MATTENSETFVLKLNLRRSITAQEREQYAVFQRHLVKMYQINRKKLDAAKIPRLQLLLVEESGDDHNSDYSSMSNDSEGESASDEAEDEVKVEESEEREEAPTCKKQKKSHNTAMVRQGNFLNFKINFFLTIFGFFQI